MMEAQAAAMRDPRPRDEAGPRPPLQLAAALTGPRAEDGAGRHHRRHHSRTMRRRSGSKAHRSATVTAMKRMVSVIGRGRYGGRHVLTALSVTRRQAAC